MGILEAIGLSSILFSQEIFIFIFENINRGKTCCLLEFKHACWHVFGAGDVDCHLKTML